MKRSLILLFIGVLITFALVSFVNMNRIYAIEDENKILQAKTSEENESKDILVVLEENVSYEVKSFITKNGMELYVGFVKNLGESREIEVYVNVVNGKWITFRPFIKENETWSFARVGEFAILPKTSGLFINPNETSYYKINKQLRINFEGKGNEIFIYSEKRPTRIVGYTNIKWSYNLNGRMIYIFRSDSDGKITVDFVDYPIVNPLIIEDRTKEEELLYDLSKIKSGFKELDEEEYRLLYEIDGIRREISRINESIKEKESEKLSFMEKIDEENRKKSDIEKLLKEHYLVSSNQVIIVAILFIILVGYSIYINLRKGEESEEE
ncbi:MAG: hypothetical protein QXZ20_00335 [Candidatus Aenigmatarchaeota archaeon]